MIECCDNCRFREGCMEEDWLNDTYDDDNWCEFYRRDEE